MVARACDYVDVDKALKSLVDGSSRYAANHSYVFRGYARIVHYNLKYSSVEIVDFFTHSIDS